MVVRKSKLIQGRGMSLWPIGIFVKSFDYLDFEKLLNHEKIHWRQQGEFPVLFYLWYIIEWFVNILIYGKRAYVNISFEQEAYDNDQNLRYLNKRKRFAWFRYIKYKPIK